MGKKGKWFSSIKKALSPVSASKKEQVFIHSCFEFNSEAISISCESKLCRSDHGCYQEKSKLKGQLTAGVADDVRVNHVDPPQQPPSEEIETFGTNINERSSTIILENATTDREVAVEDEALPTNVAPMAIDVTGMTRYGGKSVEEISAIKIQTVFRGYLVCIFSHSFS